MFFCVIRICVTVFSFLRSFLPSFPFFPFLLPLLFFFPSFSHLLTYLIYIFIASAEGKEGEKTQRAVGSIYNEDKPVGREKVQVFLSIFKLLAVTINVLIMPRIKPISSGSIKVVLWLEYPKLPQLRSTRIFIFYPNLFQALLPCY